jgi:hypothetical protein
VAIGGFVRSKSWSRRWRPISRRRKRYCPAK